MKKYLFACCLLLEAGFIFAQTDSVNSLKADSLKKENHHKITIVFAGDVMGHMPQVSAAYDSNSNSYNYEPCFRFVKPFIDSANIAIANLEVSFGGKPYTGYPTFSSPDDLGKYLKLTGFDILAMANNHCYDKGSRGFERSIRTVDSFRFIHLGTYLNIDSSKQHHPLLVEKDGFRLAFINYTYGTNGIVPHEPHVINYINRQQILTDLKIADSLHADFTIAVMHWGNEYETKPNREQRDLARFMARNGCDAIIGSHPHVVQTFEALIPDTTDSTHVVPVFYSMGNFVSNQRDKPRDGGAMFSLTLEKNNTVKVLNCNYLPYWVYRGVLNSKYQYYILPTSLYLKDPGKFNLPSEDAVRIAEFEKEIKAQFPNLNESVFYLK